MYLNKISQCTLKLKILQSHPDNLLYLRLIDLVITLIKVEEGTTRGEVSVAGYPYLLADCPGVTHVTKIVKHDGKGQSYRLHSSIL